MSRHGRLLTVLVLLSILTPLEVTAQEATPAASPTAQVPPPSCPVQPVAPGALAALLREPVPEDPDAEAPQGEPLAPSERATIGDVVATWSVCLASGDIPRLLGLFTADGIRRLLGERSPFVGGPAGLRVSILAVSDVMRLRDGRVAARVDVDPSGTGVSAPESLVVVIEQDSDGVWRIDHLLAPSGQVAAAGPQDPFPDAPPRAMLRHPIAPGPGVPAQAPGPSVPMRGSDVARTGLQLGPAPASSPEERWRAPTGWYSDVQPVVARGLVFFGGFSLGARTAILEAVDAATGGIRWQTTAPVAWAEFPDAPALGGDILFAPVQAPVAGVLAVAANTGEPLWFAPMGFTSVTGPAVDADAVYVAGWGVRNIYDRTKNDASGVVFALDQRTGRERWRYLAPVRFGPVAVGKDSVFVPSDHGLYALDRATGRKRWQARFTPDPGETATIAGKAIVMAGQEITTGKSGIFALDTNSGALLWRIDMPVATGASAGLAAVNETIFVSWWEASPDHSAEGAPTLHAYDRETGKERWVYRATGDQPADAVIGTGSVTAPVVVRDEVLFGVTVRTASSPGGEGAEGLYAVDAATGNLRWHAASSTSIRSAPAVLNGTIFAMGGRRARGDASGGSLYAFAQGSA